MNQEFYAVLHDDIDTDAGHFVPGDILHVTKLFEMAREINAPISCTICLGFDTAADWSEADENGF